MDPDRQKAIEFLDTEDPLSLRVDDEEEERGGEEEEEEKEEEDEEEDANIFSAGMLRYRARDRQEKPEEEDPQTEEPDSRGSMESPMKMRADRRVSLPCPVREHREAT